MDKEKNSQPAEKIIDIARAFENKSPRLYKWIPNFFINYLRKIAHEDQCNEYCEIHKNDTAGEFCTGSMTLFYPIIKTFNIDRWPTSDSALIAANHPLGGLDGLILMHLVSQFRTDVQFPANDLLMAFKPLHPYFIPINKHGSNKENMVKFNQAFKEKNMMIYFPAGMVSRKNDKGEIRDLDWKKTFVSKSIETKRDIYPTFVGGQNSNFFYNLARWRTKLGIKANIEMLYLADEMFRQAGKTIDIIAGKPIKWDLLDASKTHQEWADLIKAHLYKLKDNPDEDFKYGA
jgi:putative hemolysin